ncbi:MAG: type II secretion system F family protein [Kofleriaceae bacterium]|nr:type II secretion system F family protein [Kofleriaceae bacterium]
MTSPWISIIAISSSAAVVSYLVVAEGGPIYNIWKKHTEALREHFSFLFIVESPEKVAALHIAACGLLALLGIILASIPLLMCVPVAMGIPTMVLQNKELKKREKISEQLAPWLTVLANSLKSSPNISDAIANSIGLVQAPLREEIDLLVKEVSLGEHLDRAMHKSSNRLQSPLYSSVMTTLLVARKSGGDLPKILEESSSTLREMERLEGVVRCKTAEGKSQTFVLALLPFVMVGALSKVDPDLIPGLWDSTSGQMVLAASLACWLSSVALARRIIQVDI